MTPTLEQRLDLHCLDLSSADAGLERDQAWWRARRLAIDLVRASRAGHPTAWLMLKRLHAAGLGIGRVQALALVPDQQHYQ